LAFRYLKDPLFLACFSAYWLHRILSSCGMSTPLLRSYLNDAICIPFWIPIVLWVQRRLGVRRHDGPPQGHEVVIPLLILALVFEVILPATRAWSGLAAADPNDVLCYAAGGLGAAYFWTSWYGDLERRVARRTGRPRNVTSSPGTSRARRR
jgi:hypothetical protein